MINYLFTLIKDEKLGYYVFKRLQEYSPQEIKINEEQKKRICSLTYEDIFKFFDDLDLNTVANDINNYLRVNCGIENISGIIINTTNKENSIPSYHYSTLFYDEFYSRMHEDCCEMYLKAAKLTLIKIIQGFTSGYGKMSACASFLEITSGCIYKVYRMIGLCNRLEFPTVVEPMITAVNEPKVSDIISHKPNTETDAIIEQIQLYNYYVEAVVTCYYTLDVYLMQVIETSTDNGKYEKSTISIMDHSCKLDDIYDSTCENIWNNLLMQEDKDMGLEVYNDFKFKLTSTLKRLVSKMI